MATNRASLCARSIIARFDTMGGPSRRRAIDRWSSSEIELRPRTPMPSFRFDASPTLILGAAVFGRALP
jgi:hypothetical protein